MNKMQTGYKELKNNYKDVLSDLEINEAFQGDRVFNKENKSARRALIIWSIFWGAILLSCIIVIEFLTTNHGVLVWLWNKIC